MTVSLWQETAQPREAISHDVVVVGAGIVGSYAAHVLTERGRDVALVERRFPASGASGRNAGLVLVGTRDYYVEAIERFGRDEAREIWALTVDNVARMRALSKEYGVEHQETGASYLAFDDPVADQLAESAKLLERDGFQAEYVDKDRPTSRRIQRTLLRPLRERQAQPSMRTTKCSTSRGTVGTWLFTVVCTSFTAKKYSSR